MNHTPSNPNHPPTGPNHTGKAQRRMVPLSVWLCSDTTGPAPSSVGGQARLSAKENNRPQANDPAKQMCVSHRQSVGQELARHLIDTCTRDGDIVAEGFTTSEATLVAAGRLDRRGIALVPHLPLAQHIGTRLRAILTPDQLSRVQMRPCRPDQIARGLADHLGDIALVIAAPPPCEIGGYTSRSSKRGCPACRAEVWMVTTEQLGLFLAGTWRVLRPGGVLAITTTARHRGGRLIDPAPRIIRQAQGLGFRYAQHVIALRVPINGDVLVVQGGPNDLAELRDTRSRTLPPPVTVHADVCLFTKPKQPQDRPAGAAR